MGYNAYVKRVFPIPGRKAAAATAVVHGLFPASDSRMTISSIRVKAGSGAGILAVLQVERVFKGSALVAGTLLAVPGFPADSANRTIGLRYPGGQTFFRTIASQAGDALTLSDSIEAEKGITVYLMEEESADSVQEFSLAASSTTHLHADCPGVIAGKELGYPVLLYLENADGSQAIEGGVAAEIPV